MSKCDPGECIPDRGGFCIYCRYELLREVDADGNPCTGCTEDEIIKNCPVHYTAGVTNGT